MQGIHWCVVAVLLVGLVESRSVHQGRIRRVENEHFDNEAVGIDGDFLSNDARKTITYGEAPALGDKTGDVDSLLLLNNLQYLEKSKYDIDNNKDSNIFNSETKVNFVDLVKGIIQELLDNPNALGEIQAEDNYKANSYPVVRNMNNEGSRGQFINNFIDDQRLMESDEYKDLDSKYQVNKNNVFTEDEYNEYDDKSEAFREEDESVEDRVYDEDEKYFKDEGNFFENNEAAFNRLFNQNK